MAATAPSVEILVLVLRLLNVMATDLPVSAPRIDTGTEPDFMDCLCVCALRTRVTSSAGVRSEIDRKWRGGIGEDFRVERDEKDFPLILEIWRNARNIGREFDIL